jgi:hypothetical protein
MGIRKFFHKPKSLRKIVAQKDTLVSDGSDATSSHGSTSSLSCSLPSNEPVLTTVATVVTDGIAVSTFVSSQGDVADNDGLSVEQMEEIAEQAACDASTIQDEAASLATPDDYTDVAVAEQDVEDTSKDLNVAPDDAAFDDNMWLCVNNNEKIHISQPTNDMFVCLTWNLCGAEQLSFLSRDDDAVNNKDTTPWKEGVKMEEGINSKAESCTMEEQPVEDDDSGMEVELFCENEPSTEQPEIQQESKNDEVAERRYSIDSFSGDILVEEKLLPRAVEVMAKQQQQQLMLLNTVNEIEVQS